MYLVQLLNIFVESRSWFEGIFIYLTRGIKKATPIFMLDNEKSSSYNLLCYRVLLCRLVNTEVDYAMEKKSNIVLSWDLYRLRIIIIYDSFTSYLFCIHPKYKIFFLSWVRKIHSKICTFEMMEFIALFAIILL